AIPGISAFSVAWRNKTQKRARRNRFRRRRQLIPGDTMSQRYVPNTGDIIWLHFDLPKDSAAPDYKPALVLSPLSYNKKTGLIVCCAITPHIKGYPFEVLLGPDNALAVLAD